MAKQTLKKYTVIGFYEDNWQLWSEFVQARTPLEAAVKAAEKSGSDELNITSVFLGHIKSVLEIDIVQSREELQMMLDGQDGEGWWNKSI
jgi:hypothetical protein